MARLRGRAPKGERLRAGIPHGHWKTTTFIAGLRLTGIDLPHDCYVLQINGRVNSTYRRYEDALRAGLLLKYQSPHDDIKVYETNSADEVKPGTVLH
jgi:hypothetical protein